MGYGRFGGAAVRSAGSALLNRFGRARLGDRLRGELEHVDVEGDANGLVIEGDRKSVV
jgi:hypothetical protein